MDYYGKKLYDTGIRLRQIIGVFLTSITEIVIFNFLALYYITETIVLTFTPSMLRREKCLKDKAVLITGGAGGIGREMVLRMAKQGAKIIVWDTNEAAIEDLRKETTSQNYDVTFHNVDITDRKLVYKYAALAKDVCSVDILINNAGIVCGETLLDIPDEMIEKTFQVNILSHYWTTKAFLPEMIKRRKGHIVTIGSLTGLLGSYKCTDYSATKYATVGFHESLFTELKSHGYHNIKMTLVCPYFVNTGMFEGCKPPRMEMLTAKEVAKRIIAAVKREEYFVTIPATSKFLIPLKNYIPAKLKWEMIHRLIKGPQGMKGMRPFIATDAA